VLHRIKICNLPSQVCTAAHKWRGAVVQSAGKGFRLNAQMMKEEFDRAGPVLHLSV
jgi:hypothetical protein